MKRIFDPDELELMDRPQPVSAELERDLLNIRRLNRYFGSYRLVLRFIRRWIKSGDHLRIADLATGSGDIPRLIIDYARSIGANVKVDAVDQQSSTLEIARRLSTDYPEILYHEANILEWQSPEPYDLVLCTLALHHFSEDDAVRLLRRCRELSRKFVLVSDLRRGLLATVGVYLLTAFIFRESMTRYDARLSAARAFSFTEFWSLAERAGWTQHFEELPDRLREREQQSAGFGHKRFALARQAILLEG